MIVLSTFLESSLNFLSNSLEKHYKIWYSQGEKRCHFELTETQLKKTVKYKIDCKTDLE